MRPTPSPWRTCSLVPDTGVSRNRRLSRHARAERGDAVGIAGAGADHDLARRRRQQRALDHILDLIGIEDREHDRIAVARDIGERSGARRRSAARRAFFAASMS